MRCRSCNAHLSIEDEKCPYCQTPNPEAVKHRQDMHRFSGEFLRTRSSVLKTSSETAQKSARYIILLFMVVLVILSFAFLSSSWNLGYAVMEWKASANSKEYCALLDQYEEEGDYLSLAALYDQKYLYGIDAFKEYYYIYTAASNYSSIYYYLTTLLEEEQWEGQHEDYIKYLCNSLDYYYEFLEQEHYTFYEEYGAYDEVHLQAVKKLNEKLENLLRLCLNIPKEDMAHFSGLSTAEKRVLIERSYKAHE